MILEAVSEDFVPFETVAHEISACHVETFRLYENTQIESILLKSITDKDVGAYLLHSDPPYVTAVEATSDTLGRYWFHITASGKEYLSELIEKESRSLHRVRHGRAVLQSKVKIGASEPTE